MSTMDALALKSSRRKQSKPIRVSYTADAESGEVPPAHPGVEGNYVNGDVGDSGDVDKDNELPLSSIITCSKCPETFPTAEHLTDHYKNVHGDEGTLDLSRDVPFPTAYHRLGSEFLKSNNNNNNASPFVSNGHERGDLDCDKQSELNGHDLSSSQDMNGEKGQKVDGNKIFHPDAYCELCDKEFCNKYFLKTHKANKHGIYENGSSPFPASMNPLPPSMFLPQDMFPHMSSFASGSTSSTTASSMSSATQAPLPVTSSVLPPSTSSSISSLSQMVQPKPSMLSKPKSLSDTSTSSSITKPISSTVNQDLEDFCEICQKHFCNKYYLKKHKNDVHGIPPPDTGPSNVKRGGRPPNSESKLPASTGIDTSSSPLIPHSLANLPGLPNMPPGVMVLNPFLPPVLIPAQSLLSQSQLPPPPHLAGIPSSLPISSYHSEKPSPSAVNSSSATSSPPSGSIQTDGMTGPSGEAFCDICRKEFCDKYFLKIHKANKHGIYMDDLSLPTSMSMPRLSIPSSKPNDLTANTSESSSVSPHDKDGLREPKEIRPESSPKAATTPITQPFADSHMTVCNLCKQEFSSKYAYRIHRIQAHGLINEPFSEAELADEAVRLHNGDLPKNLSSRMAEEIAMMERGAEQGFSSMFGNLVAAKLADRVNCDICNKELCNKYFLKAHKQKVHGIEMSPREKPNFKPTMPNEKPEFSAIKNLSDFNNPRNFAMKQEPKDLSSQFASKFDLPMLLPRPGSGALAPMDLTPSPVIEKPSNQELVKMGMDPEAYCEICKKEFCSKYFLRTHKLNIHGIRTETDSSASMSTNLSSLPSLPSLPSLTNDLNKGKLLPPSPQVKPMNLSASGGKTKNGFEKYTWRWKEPVNSSRVICEICNKELCNKYFLRTHKLNKHGIVTDVTASPSTSISPTTSDVETSSNSSLPTDLSMREKNSQSPLMKSDNLTKVNSSRNEDSIKMPEALNLKIKSESENNRYFNHYQEVCHLCDRRFKSSKWLKAHILNDHAGLTALSPTMEKAFNLSSNRASLEQRTCGVCSIVFPSEMSMQLHMIQEHNAQVTLKSDSPSNGDINFQGTFSGIGQKFALKRRFSSALKQKHYNCSVCNYRSKWLSNILSHEKNTHGICQNGSKQMLKDRMMAVDRNVNSADVLEARPSSHRSYRCTTCGRTFPSPIICHYHIRKDHIRNRSFKVNNRLPASRISCTQCSFSTRFLKQMKRHMMRSHSQGKIHMDMDKQTTCLDIEDVNSGKSNIMPLNLHAQALSDCEENFIMQTFRLQECSEKGNFVTSVVEMPVHHRLRDSAAVSFLVTPMEQ